MSQNIYDLLLSAAHTLLKSLGERLELESALQTKGLKLQSNFGIISFFKNIFSFEIHTHTHRHILIYFFYEIIKQNKRNSNSLAIDHTYCLCDYEQLCTMKTKQK